MGVDADRRLPTLHHDAQLVVVLTSGQPSAMGGLGRVHARQEALSLAPVPDEFAQQPGQPCSR